MIRYIYSKFLKRLRPAAIRHSKIHGTSKVEPNSEVVNSTMGKHSFCGYYCEINNTDVGSFCSIANGVIIGGGAHPIAWVSTSPVFYEGRDSVKAKFSTHKRDDVLRTSIGHDVWIGQNAVIKQGVRIGNGAVIGMGAIVTKDVKPYTVVAGNPARKIRKRFTQDIIDDLEAIKWWSFSDEKIASLGQYVREPSTFIKKAKLLYKD